MSEGTRDHTMLYSEYSTLYHKLIVNLSSDCMHILLHSYANREETIIFPQPPATSFPQFLRSLPTHERWLFGHVLPQSPADLHNFLEAVAKATSVSVSTAQSKDYLPPTPAAFNPDPTYTPLSLASPNLNQQVLSEQRPMAALAASTFFLQPSPTSFPTVVPSLHHPPTNTWII